MCREESEQENQTTALIPHLSPNLREHKKEGIKQNKTPLLQQNCLQSQEQALYNKYSCIHTAIDKVPILTWNWILQISLEGGNFMCALECVQAWRWWRGWWPWQLMCLCLYAKAVCKNKHIVRYCLSSQSKKVTLWDQKWLVERKVGTRTRQAKRFFVSTINSKKRQLTYLYCIVSEVVEALSFVIKILTMLNRNTKFIWKRRKREEKIKPLSQTVA